MANRAWPTDDAKVLRIARESINKHWPDVIAHDDEPVSESYGKRWQVVFEKDGWRYMASRSRDERGDVQVDKVRL